MASCRFFRPYSYRNENDFQKFSDHSAPVQNGIGAQYPGVERGFRRIHPDPDAGSLRILFRQIPQERRPYLPGRSRCGRAGARPDRIASVRPDIRGQYGGRRRLLHHPAPLHRKLRDGRSERYRNRIPPDHHGGNPRLHPAVHARDGGRHGRCAGRAGQSAAAGFAGP